MGYVLCIKYSFIFMAEKEVIEENISTEIIKYVDGACFGVDCLGSYNNIKNSVNNFK